MQKVFVSYSSEDSTHANQIVSTLESKGIPCWIAPRDIPAGSSYTTSISQAIDECSFFLLILSPQSLDSLWVRKELARAVNLSKQILPLMLEDFQLNGEMRFYLGNIQAWRYCFDPKGTLDAMIAFIRSSAPLSLDPETISDDDLPELRHVFISHSTVDEEEALIIANHLQKQKVLSWMAPRDTRSHTSYPAQITQAIRECPIFLLLISKASMKSSHVEREIALAIDKRVYAGNKYIIPLMLEDCTLSDDFMYYLANQHYYPYHSQTEEVLAKVTEQILQFIRNDKGSALTYLQTADRYNEASNYQEAVKWYHRAAALGNSQAQSMMGYYYHTGKLGEKKPLEAIKWYEKAVEQDHSGAMEFLGYCYAYELKPNDWPKAFTLFNRAAERNNAGAQRHLAMCYEEGKGVDKDLDEAKQWYEKAAANGDAEAAKKLKTFDLST